MNKDDKRKTHISICGKSNGGGGSTDWNDITNKPDFATVATSGDYEDLSNKPTIPTKTSELTNDSGFTTFDGDYNSLTNKPDLATVATSGDYTDLTNKPTIPAAQVNSDWNSNSGVSQILNKPTLATVATSGNYSDLNGTPSLATVATSGDYDDLQNKPTIPAAPVQSDWNESNTSSLAYIANKPVIPAAQVQADWNQNDTTAVDYIKNKPTIPSVPAMATQELTFTLQDGTIKTIEFYTVPNYFYVEDISGSDNILTIKNDSNTNPVEVFKSTDRSNWTSMGITNSIGITATIPANSKLYLKAITNNFGGEFNPNIITASGNHNVGGNTMSLMYGDSFENKTVFPTGSSRNLSYLFYNNSKLINANNLELPATTLTAICYYEMFSRCTNLVTAPQSLPATTLTVACYMNMFKDCTSLTTAPALSATTLANNCCQQMFNNCKALTTAPVLLATTLVQNSYNGMFDSCTNLNKVVTYAQDISASSCIYVWLSNVAATGDFYNLGGITYPSGANGIPSGWTEHTSL